MLKQGRVASREGSLKGWTELTVPELQAFLSIAILMGVTHLPCFTLLLVH